MFENIFDTVIQATKEWTPKEQYSNENKYRDDLVRFLRARLNRSQDILGLGTSEKHLIRTEAGRHLADIGIDEKIGIELKLNFQKQGELDRLVGQVKRFLRAYSHVIVVLCGDVDHEKFDALRYELREYAEPSFSIGEPQRVVKIVSKSSKSGKSEPQVSKSKTKSVGDYILGR